MPVWFDLYQMNTLINLLSGRDMELTLLHTKSPLALRAWRELLCGKRYLVGLSLNISKERIGIKLRTNTIAYNAKVLASRYILNNVS